MGRRRLSTTSPRYLCPLLVFLSASTVSAPRRWGLLARRVVAHGSLVGANPANTLGCRWPLVAELYGVLGRLPQCPSPSGASGYVRAPLCTHLDTVSAYPALLKPVVVVAPSRAHLVGRSCYLSERPLTI